MAIREATTDDVPAIRDVARRSWERDYPDVVSRETIDEGVDDWYSPERIAEELSRARTVVLVAEDAGSVVGFVHAHWTDEVGYVLRLYVDPDHRRAGVGTRLFDRVRDALFGRGVDRIDAMVLADNEIGNSFYRTLGFERGDQRETTIGPETHPENTYVLERDRAIDG